MKKTLKLIIIMTAIMQVSCVTIPLDESVEPGHKAVSGTNLEAIRQYLDSMGVDYE